MQAAGKHIEPYWQNYAFHHKQEIYDILEKYKIGKTTNKQTTNAQANTSQLTKKWKKKL